MKPKIQLSSLDRSGKRSSGSVRQVERTLDPSESPVNIGLIDDLPKTNAQLAVAPRSSVPIDLLTVTQAADLLIVHEATIRTGCRKGKYPGAEKQLGNGGEGWLIPVASLPKAAQKAYAKKFVSDLIRKTGVCHAKSTAQLLATIPDSEYTLQWELFEKKPGGVKEAAQKAFEALIAYWELVDSGMPKESAKKAIEASHGAARATLHRSINKTNKHPRRHWLPLLCPQWHGGRERATYTPEAQAFILALRIKSPQTNLRALIRIARKEGEGKGWIIPSEDTVSKRLQEESAWLTGGKQALERSFPVVERDYASLALHQCWESDGRRADVFCIWPDGQITRPFVVAWRDVRSRMALSARICFNPDAEAVLGSFGAALANTQAVPATVKIDNGREYANKAFTGAQKTRYRFKPKVDEAIGILTAMGVVAKWSKPGQGRDKPIESWWNVVAENCDKHPAFAGAYCGENAVSKPEDFDKKKAIPVAAYAARLIECMNEFHHTPHRGQGMNGRAPLDVYAELTATRAPNPPNETELRRCKMGVKSLKLDKKEATFKFQIEGYLPRRYWHEALSDMPLSMRDKLFNVHYEWGNPDAAVAVYSGDTFICDAKPIDRIEFLESDGEKVRAHMEEKNAYIKQRRTAIHAAKAHGNVTLPDMRELPELAALPGTTPDLMLVPPRKTPTAAQPASSIEAIPGRPGESIDKVTGEVYISEEVRRAQAKAQMKQEEQETEAELEEMARKMREKNLPVYLR